MPISQNVRFHSCPRLPLTDSREEGRAPRAQDGIVVARKGLHNIDSRRRVLGLTRSRRQSHSAVNGGVCRLIYLGGLQCLMTAEPSRGTRREAIGVALVYCCTQQGSGCREADELRGTPSSSHRDRRRARRVTRVRLASKTRQPQAKVRFGVPTNGEPRTGANEMRAGVLQHRTPR